MGDITIKYGASNQAITITLASLAAGSFRESSSIDNSTNLFLDALVGGQITTGTSPTVDSTINIYAYGSVDGGTIFSGNASGTDADYTGPDEQLILIGSILVDATSDKTYEFGPFSIAQAFGGSLPSSWGIVVENDTGVALNGTAANHDVNYQGVFAQAA